MEIREIRQDEREAAFYVASQAFASGSRDMSRMDHPDRLPRAIFGVWDDAGLQAVASIIEYTIHLGADATAPMGGIAAVACLPASRGKGYAGAVLRYSLEQMRLKGQTVSVLFPFSFDYYSRLGWAWVGVQRTYEVNTRALRVAPETEHVRAATEADRPAIIAAYTKYAHRYRGAIVREEKLWNMLLNSSEKEYRFTYIYEENGRVEGYLTYLGGKREKTHLREFVALNPRAEKALLGLLRRHDMQIDKIEWAAPDDDLLWLSFMHWDLDTKLEPVAMARIVDIPAALAAWKPAIGAAGELNISVQDEHAPWNTGCWRIEFQGREVIASATNEAPHLSMDIGALSQAYFGSPTLPEIRDAGRMTVFEEAAFNSLRDLLAGPTMWMNDHF